MIKFAQIENWSMLLKILFLFAVCLLATSLAYFYIFSAQFKEMNHLTEQETALKIQYRFDNKKIHQANALKTQFNTLKSIYNRQIKQYRNMSQSDVIKNVSRLAKALNLHLRALDSYSKNKTNSFKLNMTGKYRKINKFLKQTLKPSSPYILNRMQLTHNKKNYLCRLNFALLTNQRNTKHV